MQHIAALRSVAPRMSGKDQSRPNPYIAPDRDAYEKLYLASIGVDKMDFWTRMANETLNWFEPFQTALSGDFSSESFHWFREGRLNASYNCLDRWAEKSPDKIAIIHEGDEPGQHQKISYRHLLDETCRIANVLKSWGCRKGDRVTIYMPMVWQTAAAMLACSRIGAIHSVVFAGFSAGALKDRILDCQSKIVLTADEARRGGRSTSMKTVVDTAIADCPFVERVLVFRRTGNDVPWDSARDEWYHDMLSRSEPFCAAESMESEDPLFVLYTSGSTAKPKGLIHTTAGYLLGVAMTTKYVFDLHPEDTLACMADVGWITGHSYILYGPLLLGATTLMFESTPVYPDPSRYWAIVQEHKVTQLYTAPTAIRLLRKLGDEHVSPYDLSSLRVLGTVGEPIQEEVWHWYDEVVGSRECAIVDTYWSTETGSHVITTLPGAIETRPGSAGLPFFGIEPVLIDPSNGRELQGSNVEGVLCLRTPWPSLARSIYGDHARYKATYLEPYPGLFYTSDAAFRDSDGYIWIKGQEHSFYLCENESATQMNAGRVDDVINVSGHRISTAEAESAVLLHPGVAETAVVPKPDAISGHAVLAFVAMKDGRPLEREQFIKEITLQVRQTLGAFAAPKTVIFVDDLPKTRSGKIMRRVLRAIAEGQTEDFGDLATLANPEVIAHICKCVESTN